MRWKSDFTLTDLQASDYKQVLQKYFGCIFHQMMLLLYLLALTRTQLAPIPEPDFISNAEIDG